ncbi:MAG: Peptidase, family [Parcubacteria group bacterium]|nr:Peptidase, family [Parcubacteria group bacterium]
MKKYAVLVIMFVLLGFLFPHAGQAAVEDELRQKILDAQTQRTALQAEQIKLQAELDKLNSQDKTLQGAVKSLDATKKKLATDIKLTQNKITSTDLNIRSLEDSMLEKEHQIDLHHEAIKTALKQLSAYDAHNIVTDLLTYPMISEVWSDQGSLEQLQNTLSGEINALKDAQAALDQEKALKEKNKEDLVGLKSQLGGQKQVVEQTQAAKNKLLAETKSKEAAYQKLIADNKVREAKFEADLFNYENQLKVALDPASIPIAANSILSWPISKVKITQQFGKTSSSGRLYASGTHNGVDFGMPVGTAVMSVRQGVVKGTGNTDSAPGCYSYGRWILIEHDDGLSTIYGHLSASVVQTGQTIARGQVIGYSGGQPGVNGSGYSTGPHLHLGLYATQAVKIQVYTTSIGCKGTSIPIAPPNGYLDPLAYLPAL